jgi:conjugal transfer pilus assembly protein TraB
MDVRKGFIEKIKEKWETIPTEQKSKFIKIGVALLLMLVGLMGYVLSHRSKEQSKEVELQNQNKTQEIGMNVDLLQKTQYYEAQKQLENLKKELEELKKEKEAKEKEVKEKEIKEERKIERTPSVPPPPPPTVQAQVPPPPPPEPPGTPPTPPPPPKPEVVGDIKVVSKEIQEEKKEVSNETKEIKKKQVYLPPSFMEATLLSGLDAPAVGKGEANPVPVLLRVKAPAVLPNKVKANLRGCFVIAEGLGNLASERADLRLVSLSCIDKKGRAVIDQKIKGFVVDSDGKIGLRGRVVSKMGAILARSLIAGLFSGLGQAVSMQGYSYYPYPTLGSEIIKPGEIAKTTFASGITQAAANLQKFYLDLASQTIPVVEIQATRNVTLVISEGVNLEIKELDLLN